MKKLLLIPALTIGLIGCGDPKNEVAEIAEDYCEAIGQRSFTYAQNIALNHVVDANERWFNKNQRKFIKIFMKQQCSVDSVEANEDNTKFTVYYSPSSEAKGSYVEIEYFEDKDDYLVTSDMFAVYQYFY